MKACIVDATVGGLCRREAVQAGSTTSSILRDERYERATNSVHERYKRVHERYERVHRRNYGVITIVIMASNARPERERHNHGKITA